MHKIQEVVDGIDDLDDERLIDEVTAAWGIVCSENEQHEEYVSKETYKQWTGYKADIDNKIILIINEYSGKLNDNQREILLSIANFIKSAGHKSEKEFIEERQLSEDNARIRQLELEEKQQEKDRLASKKKNWLKLFNR